MLPQSLLHSLEGVKGFDRAAFEAVHQSGEQVTSIRLNPIKWQNIKTESTGKEQTGIRLMFFRSNTLQSYTGTELIKLL